MVMRRKLQVSTAETRRSCVPVMLQIEDLHLVREKDTGKSKGFAFVKYEDQKSTILAVDNFNGVKVRAYKLSSA